MQSKLNSRNGNITVNWDVIPRQNGSRSISFGLEVKNIFVDGEQFPGVVENVYEPGLVNELSLTLISAEVDGRDGGKMILTWGLYAA